MILCGIRNFKSVKGKSIKSIHCEYCGNDSKWQLINLWTWFTLFFIPLFPIWKKKMLICPACNYGMKINQKNEEQIMEEVELDN